MTPYLVTFGGYILAMLASYGLGRWLTGLARMAALQWGVLSPVTQRSSHSVPTPRLGGLGLALGFGLPAGGWIGMLWLMPHEGAVLGFNPGPLAGLAAGWLGMFAVGLADDVLDLPALLKLGLMGLSGMVAVIAGGLKLEPMAWGFLPTWLHALISGALALGWILFFTNAFNFMDGMDGFAANFARMSAMAMFLALFLPGLHFGNLNYVRAETYLLPLLAMACWGFLHWNRPPARVFMGDCGSLSTGYLLAVFPLMGQSGRLGLPLPWQVSLAILMPFLFDVVLTLVRRARMGENLLRAHREHLYQRLMRAGGTHAGVLRMNLWRFGACAAAGLAGQWVGHWVGIWLGLAASMGIMLQYWWATLARERMAAQNDAVRGDGTIQ